MLFHDRRYEILFRENTAKKNGNNIVSANNLSPYNYNKGLRSVVIIFIKIAALDKNNNNTSLELGLVTIGYLYVV